jgi:uncharacterized protein YcbK (DUF882 family)
MMKISRNFSRSEFACRCGCGFATVDVELIGLLERIRQHFKGASVMINSACRCPEHNADIGGHESSKHMQGIAADIRVKGIHPMVVYQYIDHIAPDRYGLGNYNNFTHIDIQPTKKRWHG